MFQKYLIPSKYVELLYIIVFVYWMDLSDLSLRWIKISINGERHKFPEKSDIV